VTEVPVIDAHAHVHYWAGEDLARTAWELANAGVAAHCAVAPDRLIGLGLVPLQHPGLAAVALDHALSLGLHGVEISSHAPGTPGRELSDPEYAPFRARAERTGTPGFPADFHAVRGGNAADLLGLR
jgi:aminocarboxymuconate-semialdehyde decarboxylase